MPLIAVIVLTVCVHTAYAGGRVAVSLLAIDLGAAAATIGAILSLFAVLPMLSSVAAGRMIDRVGVRGPMTVAAAIAAAGAAAAYFSPTLGVLAVVSTAVGSGFMLFHLAVSNLVGAAGAPADRPRNFSMFSMGFSVSGFLGPMLAGFAIDQLGFRNTFLLLAAFPLATFLVLLARGSTLPAAGGAHAREGRRRVTDLLRNREIRTVFAVSGTLSMGWDLFSFVVPIYAARIGHSASTIGVIVGAFSVATFLVRVVLPGLARRFGEWRMLAGAFLTGCVVYGVYPFATPAPLLVALAFVLGLGLGSSQPMVLSVLYNTVPPGRAGEAVGVRNALVNASQTLMPLVFGALGTALGMVPVFWTMALFLGAGGWFAARR
ncbi:MAG: MFS transporter [Burkholderiales bacterium]|nr:MFS transporter [Burkholderiales bacterium]